jgi:hypothetical protein
MGLFNLLFFLHQEFSLAFFGASFRSSPMEKHLTGQLVLSGVPLILIISSPTSVNDATASPPSAPRCQNEKSTPHLYMS